MIGLDTNVVVRYIMQDDAKQAAQATRLFDSFTTEEPGFIPLIAVVELTWVLSSCFGLTREDIAQALVALLRAQELVVENAALVARALRVFRSGGADFADCIIERSANTAGCRQSMTFDKTAAKYGMTLIV